MRGRCGTGAFLGAGLQAGRACVRWPDMRDHASAARGRCRIDHGRRRCERGPRPSADAGCGATRSADRRAVPGGRARGGSGTSGVGQRCVEAAHAICPICWDPFCHANVVAAGRIALAVSVTDAEIGIGRLLARLDEAVDAIVEAIGRPRRLWERAFPGIAVDHAMTTPRPRSIGSRTKHESAVSSGVRYAPVTGPADAA